MFMFQFTDDAPPHDEIRIEEKLVTISPTGFAAICTLCGLGLLLACGLLIFNVVMRKQKYDELNCNE